MGGGQTPNVNAAKKDRKAKVQSKHLLLATVADNLPDDRQSPVEPTERFTQPFIYKPIIATVSES